MTKKSTSSEESFPKKKKPQGRNITLSDGTQVKVNDNQKGDVKKGKKAKHIIKPAKQYSTESGKDYEDYEVEDDYDSLDYPPPSKHPLFRKFWAEAIDSLSERENFKEVHLGLFEVYCRLRVELRNLDDFITRNGHTYRTVSVLGEIRKTYPEVAERLKVLSQLANYMKMLDLVPKKDKKITPKKKEEGDWS